MNFIVACVAAVISYWLWPTGISDIPLSQLTLGGVGSLMLSIIFGFGACTGFLASMDS